MIISSSLLLKMEANRENIGYWKRIRVDKTKEELTAKTTLLNLTPLQKDIVLL